jgi:DNA-directed RNA polymerase specialized sigma24 family protein
LHYKYVEAVALADEAVRAFDASYEVLFGELTRLSRALGAGPNAEDVAQDALVYGREHLDELRDPARLRPWLRTIAVRSAARHRPRSSAREMGETAFLPVDPGLGLDASAAVARLPARERAAVVLVYGLGYGQDDVAEMMGISRGTVAASLWKARQRLARDLAAYRREGDR